MAKRNSRGSLLRRRFVQGFLSSTSIFSSGEEEDEGPWLIDTAATAIRTPAAAHTPSRRFMRASPGAKRSSPEYRVRRDAHLRTTSVSGRAGSVTSVGGRVVA